MTSRTCFHISYKVELIDMLSLGTHFSTSVYVMILKCFDTLSTLVMFMLLLNSIRAWVSFDLSTIGNWFLLGENCRTTECPYSEIIEANWKGLIRDNALLLMCINNNKIIIILLKILIRYRFFVPTFNITGRKRNIAAIKWTRGRNMRLIKTN